MSQIDITLRRLALPEKLLANKDHANVFERY
jgi:hypothetical protein